MSAPQPSRSSRSHSLRRFFRRLTTSPPIQPPQRHEPHPYHTQFVAPPSYSTQPNTGPVRPPLQRPLVIRSPPTSATIEIDISAIDDLNRERLCLPSPEESDIFRLDPADWAIAQQNFGAPLGHHFDPDDPEKPNELAIVYDPNAPIFEVQSRFVRQHQHSDDDPPPYKWAKISALPRPVKISQAWSSLYAAQREKSQLLDTRDYISSRLSEIDRKVASIMSVKQQDFPYFDYYYVMRRAQLDLEPIDISASHANAPIVFELIKAHWLREMLSPVSLLQLATWWWDNRHWSPIVAARMARRVMFLETDTTVQCSDRVF